MYIHINTIYICIYYLHIFMYVRCRTFQIYIAVSQISLWLNKSKGACLQVRLWKIRHVYVYVYQYFGVMSVLVGAVCLANQSKSFHILWNFSVRLGCMAWLYMLTNLLYRVFFIKKKKENKKNISQIICPLSCTCSWQRRWRGAKGCRSNWSEISKSREWKTNSSNKGKHLT